MFYRIRIDLSFQDEADLEDIKDKALDKLPDSLTLHPGKVNEERGYIITEKCFHDEHPSIPCIIIEEHQSPI